MSEALATAFEAMKGRYKTGVVDGPVTFYFSLGESDGQKWLVTLTPESCEVKPGKGDADCFLKMEEDLFLKMINGQYTPGVMDFMSGKIKSNDPTRLTLLKDCFA